MPDSTNVMKTELLKHLLPWPWWAQVLGRWAGGLWSSWLQRVKLGKIGFFKSVVFSQKIGFWVHIKRNLLKQLSPSRFWEELLVIISPYVPDPSKCLHCSELLFHSNIFTINSPVFSSLYLLLLAFNYSSLLSPNPFCPLLFYLPSKLL